MCILGLGLIGGSLLRDLHAIKHPVFGYNRSPISAPGLDISTSLPDTLTRAAENNALIILATPMPVVPQLLAALPPQCEFTDVVSMKTAVAAAVHAQGLDAQFVGGHPMAGAAESGWEATRLGLFQDAAWPIMLDDAATKPHLWADVALLAQLVGARPIPTTAARHDAAVARISHLPHILAEALATTGAAGGTLALSLAAGSFRDGTRVAAARPELVRAICEPNAPAVLAALDELLETLTTTRQQLHATGTLGELPDNGHAARKYYEEVSTAALSLPPVEVCVGAPGWVQELEAAETAGRWVRVLGCV